MASPAIAATATIIGNGTPRRAIATKAATAIATAADVFSALSVVTFGGAYAVLAWVAQAAVERFGWLAPGEMLDGLAMAETTPGPLIMVLLFVGFMAAFRDPGALSPIAAGVLGGTLATWVTFVPCFLWIFAGAPFAERLRENRAWPRRSPRSPQPWSGWC